MDEKKKKEKEKERPLEVPPSLNEKLGRTEILKRIAEETRIWVAIEGEGMGMKRLKNAGYVDCCNNSRSAQPGTAW